MKCIKIIFLMIFICSSSVFSAGVHEEKSSVSDNLLTALSGLKISTAYQNAFPLYNMNEYSKNGVGASVGFEYALLPEILKNLDLGFYGRFAFLNFIPCNIQLVSLYSYGFSGGFFVERSIPDDISFFCSLGAGFLINDMDFVSSESGKINDIYYDFMMETDFKFRKAVYKNNGISILFDMGGRIGFYNEKSEGFWTAGPAFGVTIDFKPFRMGK